VLGEGEWPTSSPAASPPRKFFLHPLNRRLTLQLVWLYRRRESPRPLLGRDIEISGKITTKMRIQLPEHIITSVGI
jgi:hypothetical protein